MVKSIFGDPTGEEKRIHPRTPLMLRVEYPNTAEFLSDWTENISGGGVFVATDERFQEGDRIEFSMSFPGFLAPIALLGLVKWLRPAGDDSSPAGIGIEFLVEQSPGKEALQRLLTRLRQAPEKEPTSENSMFRVLLVEDNAVVRDMFRFAIQKLSSRSGLGNRFEVQEAENGKQAWDLLRQRPFHMVIVDLYMPVMEGGQLIEFIRRDAGMRNLPVLVVSSGGREGRQRAQSCGADVYLDKPIKLKQMMESIETLMALGHVAERE